ACDSLFKALNHMTQLKSLKLINCAFGTPGVMESMLRHSPQLSSMQKLILTSNQISDDNIEALAALSRRYPELSSLDLTRNGVSMGGLETLQNMAPTLMRINMHSQGSIDFL
ncbi:hypothetical protein KIPB_010943, partial [Kipferlia bialata]